MRWKWKTTSTPTLHESPLHQISARWPTHFSTSVLPMSQRLAQLQRDDPTLGPIMAFLADSELPSDQKLKRAIKTKASHFIIINSVLHFRDHHPDRRGGKPRFRTAIPAVLVEPIIRETHGMGIGAHIGEEKLIDLLRTRYHWNNMYASVRKFLPTCECALASSEYEVSS